jgi:hypothetical protein
MRRKMLPTKRKPTRSPHDLCHRQALRHCSGRFDRPGAFPMNSQNPTTRPCMAATYAPGTVRARRWHGDGDMRGYRPPNGWTACADLTDIQPISGQPCRVRCGGSSKPKNNSSPRRIAPGAVSQNPGAAVARRTRFQHPKQNRHVAAFDQAATWRAQVPCARYGDRCPPMRARFRWRPPQWAGLMRLRPGSLRQVVQKQAVHDAGGSSPVRDEGRFTDTRARPCLWNFHATPQAGGRKLRQGRSRLVAGRDRARCAACAHRGRRLQNEVE